MTAVRGYDILDMTVCQHVCIYSDVNVENMNLYEPPMNMDPEEDTQIKIVDDLAPEYMNEL